MVHSNNTIIWIVLILQCSDLHCLVGKIIHEILLSEKVDYGKHVSYSISMTFLWGVHLPWMYTLMVSKMLKRLLLSGRISDHFFLIHMWISYNMQIYLLSEKNIKLYILNDKKMKNHSLTYLRHLSIDPSVSELC